MDILERFLNYVKIPTNSSSFTDTVPSTKEQFVLADLLAKELEDLGLEVEYDKEHCIVYAVLKGNVEAPSVGFISHLDTSEAAHCENINPQIIKNYDGKDILLSDGIITKVEENEDLKNHVGKTLITTDGKTLLGADDKAGIAEIMTMLEHFKFNNEDHGDIWVAFTADEEIGNSIDHFDISKFKADFAYTVDGSAVGEVCYENFNAAKIEITIKGTVTHFGYAKGKLVNAIKIAEIIDSLVPNEVPENTEGKEGYYMLESLEGNVGLTNMVYILRDFDYKNLEHRKSVLQEIVKKINENYNNCVEIAITDGYKNMYEALKDNLYVVDIVKEVIKSKGLTPISPLIRGGTDGAELVELGLMCPNLGTGGHNFHSVNEYITLEDMVISSEILIGIVNSCVSKRDFILSRIKKI